jgi:CheY-like chemotaxis protein
MDDEEPIRDVARAMLSRLGYRVEVAADGEAAVERYRDALLAGDRFDAVLMDLTIPGGMGGKAAIKELLALDPGATAIVSSGYADAPVMAEFEQYGFKGVVPKPFTIAELSRLLQQVMQGSAA